MPRLIHLNGPTACGKSTLARRYVNDHPLALDLDLDQVRDLIGNWREHQPDAGQLTRDIAIAAARVHLASGHDVVVPQLLAEPLFIDKLASLAREVGAAFHEIMLIDSKPNMLRRFRQRRVHPNSDTSEQELSDLYDRLLALLPTRPNVRVIHIDDGQPELAYQAILSTLAKSGI
ncbi:MAG TPA: AAA family ATPase [Pseudonocardiaceae bacterium]|nr:AAA family ATPase [Pseudonocardiaceae bacterium]